MRIRDRARGPVGRLFSVATLSFAMVAAPVVQPDQGEPPSVEVRTTSLTRSATFSAATFSTTAAGDDGWTLFDPVASGDTVMVAADWGGSQDVEVQIRALEDGRWTPWFQVVYEPDHGPDLVDLPDGHTTTTDSDPLWLGASEQVQVRARGPVGDVDLVRMEQPGGADFSWTPPVQRPGAAQAATDRPDILSRASWGADESIRRYTPREWSRANFAIVHHTAGRNDYRQDEVDDILRSIYAYHVVRRGWDDIAYNFLVDRFGTVWEGRAGGITRPVIGGHASGFNGGSIGVSAIGNYQATEPTPEMVQGIQDVLAWKLDLHHVDPHGTSEEIAGGGSSNRFNPGDRVTLPNIIGHRHTNSTTCPGDKLQEHVLGLHGDTSFADRIDSVGHPKAYGGPPQDREQPLHGIRPQWDVTFTEAVTWQLTIADEDGNVVRRGTGASSGDLDLAWDMRDSAGRLVAPGRYVGQLDAMSGSGDAVVPVTTIFDVTPAAERRSGESRTETATELSSFAFEHSERVVIASAEAFPDALVAGPLAGSLDAPILLVPAAGVPGEVVDEIRRLHASKAYIVGGEGRIPAKVEADLRASGITSITRLAGSNRYETSAAVARFLINRDHPREALLALGEHPDPNRAFPDALSAGAFGASQVAPVLLMAPNALHPAIDAVLGQRPWFDGLVVFGGTGAITQAAVDAAAEAAARYEDADPEDIAVQRFAGRDRYETSTLAAEEVLARTAAKVEEDGPSPYAEPTGFEVILASGRNWPDALGAGAAAARRGAAFALVDPDTLANSSATATWLRSRAAELAHAVVSGGPTAVSDQVVQSVGAIVASEGHASAPRESWPGESGTSFPFPSPLFPSDPEPTQEPSEEPTGEPTEQPAEDPGSDPSEDPGGKASGEPSEEPTDPIALPRLTD